jgi:ABC-2 type transport system permease protein
MSPRPFYAVVERELVRMFRQRGRLLAAMVRPLIWLLVIGTGLDAMLGRAGDGSYRYFLVPGVVGMTMLFGAMIASLSTVYDKESGVMRMLVVAPFPHHWIVVARTLSATAAAVVQALLLLGLLVLLGYVGADARWGLLLAGLVATSLACASLGMLVAAWSPTLENFAVIMNLVIFPVFFLSGALYPVQHLPDWLRWVASINPFTYGVDLLKHASPAATGARFAPDFAVATDLAVLLGFCAAATVVASLRFARDAACEPLIHALARGR